MSISIFALKIMFEIAQNNLIVSVREPVLGQVIIVHHGERKKNDLHPFCLTGISDVLFGFQELISQLGKE